MQTMPTLPEFKQWAKDVAPAARAVVMARAFAQVERERVDAYIRPIFDSFKFVYGAKHGRDLPYVGLPLTDPDHLYLVDDEVMVSAYFAECDATHRMHGFKGPEGHCPALIAENLLMQTERQLIELAQPLFGIEHIYGDNRTKYLDLLLGACLKAEQEIAA